MNEFSIPSTLVYGRGAALTAGERLRTLGKRVLVITDGHLAEQTSFGHILDALAAAGLHVHIYAGVNSEPDTRHVQEGLEHLRSHGSDCVLAVGGGSPIDAAKAVSIMATNSGSVNDYLGHGRVPCPGVPLAAVPTTAGTGSEVTRFTIITDPVTDVKMLIGSPHLMPGVALVDPNMTLDLPRPLIASTGLDALTHAIEAFVSRKAQPFSDVMALSAMGLLERSLLRSWENPADVEARCETMLGALQAGIAFSNASVALVHGMSRPLGAVFHIGHGVSNALLLAAVMEFSLPGNPERYAAVARAFGVPGGGDPMETALAGVDRVRRLVALMHVPTCASLGITRDGLDRTAVKMAEDALASGSPDNNPLRASREDIIRLYYSAASLSFPSD